MSCAFTFRKAAGETFFGGLKSDSRLTYVESGAARCREIAEAGHPTAALRLNAEIARAATAKSIETAGQILSLMTRAGGAGLLVLHDGAQTLIQDGARSMTGALAVAREAVV